MSKNIIDKLNQYFKDKYLGSTDFKSSKCFVKIGKKLVVRLRTSRYGGLKCCIFFPQGILSIDSIVKETLRYYQSPMSKKLVIELTQILSQNDHINYKFPENILGSFESDPDRDYKFVHENDKIRLLDPTELDLKHLELRKNDDFEIG